MAQVCDFVDEVTNQCLQWSVFKLSWLDEVNNLTQVQANYIIVQCVGFWLLCWGFKALLKFIDHTSN